MNPLSFVRTTTEAPAPVKAPPKHARMKSVSLKSSRAAALVKMQTKRLEESVDTRLLSCKEKEIYDKFIHDMQNKKQETASGRDGRAALRQQLLLNCNGNR